MKKIFLLVPLALLLTACNSEGTVSLQEHEDLQTEFEELKDKNTKLNGQIEDLKSENEEMKAQIEEQPDLSNTDTTEEEADSNTDIAYNEPTEEEFLEMFENTQIYLEEEYVAYRDRYLELESNHLDKSTKEISDYDKLKKESSLLYIELEDKCEGLFTKDTPAANLDDRVFFNNVYNSCTSLANAFEYLYRYDTDSESVELFFNSSESDYDKAYEYYTNLLEENS